MITLFVASLLAFGGFCAALSLGRWLRRPVPRHACAEFNSCRCSDDGAPPPRCCGEDASEAR